MRRVLVTGGAGFIGNAIVNTLYKDHEVIVLDNFSPQIHGESYEDSFLYQNIKEKCTIIKGDVCSSEDISSALKGVEYVIHLAAETGTGQSRLSSTDTPGCNILGLSNLLESILKNKCQVRKIILSSSRSVYGEGMYQCSEHGTVVPDSRNIQDMKNGDFEVKCPVCGGSRYTKAHDRGLRSQADLLLCVYESGAREDAGGHVSGNGCCLHNLQISKRIWCRPIAQ